MLQQVLTYTDYNGIERTETFLFHLSEREAFKIASKYGGDLENFINALNVNQDVETMISFLEEIILGSYGKKSPDGRTFEKSDKIKMEFENSQAYSDLFMKMLTEPEFAANFASGLASGAKGDKSEKPEDSAPELTVLDVSPEQTEE